MNKAFTSMVKEMDVENLEEQKQIEVMNNKQKKRKGFNRQELKDFKKKMMKILETGQMIGLRPSKMCIDQFLKLLCIFNEEKIHFT